MSSKEKISVSNSVVNYARSKVEFNKGSTIASNTAIQVSTLYFNKSDSGIVKDQDGSSTPSNLRCYHGLTVISTEFNRGKDINNV
jgi:hypothetical protein